MSFTMTIAPSTIGLWKAIPGYWDAFGIQSTSLPRAIIGPSPLFHLAIHAVGMPEIPYSISNPAEFKSRLNILMFHVLGDPILQN